MIDKQITNILQSYKKQQIFKIEDFLLSEIDEDNLQETIDFVVSDDVSKKINFSDELYDGNEYEGVFLEGNQYLLSSSEGKVMIIDMLSEAHGVNIKDTRVQFDEEKFIKLITNKKEILNWIKNYKVDK
ncbi:hypothetical protein ABI013_12745 [Enterococcus faecium]|uniref:Uncharacterized protein n=2 Tax=Enterococcus TaxID=1350 RepID=A0AAE4KYJ5_ENTGA|nr:MULTISPECIES: hypothetical protein [Enterococcus]MBO0422879.1 hypothetical protein [Enterococcus plantarum]MBD9709260.1 hypothetical protein [Enterococcus faecium]MBM6740214.1 hypothetical protein [Enterococcus gallinarum]MBO0468768.1 hypothetical protein [Enterococcus plantarum]MBO6419871.1 hypothetical protein [Enterococcus gallinarum]